MLMVGALSGTVGAVALVALMVLGEYAFSPAAFLAILVAGVVALVLTIGFHRKSNEPSAIVTRAAAPAAKAPAAQPTPVAASAPAAMPSPAPVAVVAQPAESVAPAADGTRPAALSGPRADGADDLKQIRGIGPKLEEMCHSLGFYHFDQIANWSAAEVAWVDENLEGFKGRVSRDTWVEQARSLAAGGETEFSRKMNEGNVY